MMKPPDAPQLALRSLDHLWFQVTGTLCNLTCGHCFISCRPDNHRFGFLSLETVRRFLEESVEIGVKEYYFTGGEPFLHPQMVQILEETLRLGPATVLTNGTVFRKPLVARLAELSAESRYSLELRVSIDGPDPETNDPIRGQGTFEAALRGVRLLAEAGFLPILTAVQTWEEPETPRMLRRFEEALRAAGSSRPRVKIIPTLRIGMEESRTRGYREDERVTREMLEGYDQDQLICNHSRIVTDRGVAVCPILIEAPDAHLGSTLAEASRPFPLAHRACSTCYLHGAICANAPASGD
jgi:MoaA/NifB/PqqE/SkfB family radical SAM enzyme